MSLHLDERRRAMLEQMGIHVWQPLEPVQPASVAVPAVTVSTVGAGAGASPPLHQTESKVARSSTSNATNNIAINEDSTGTSVTFISEIAVRTVPVHGLAGVAGMDWPALRQAVADCRACKLCSGRKNTVFGTGPAPVSTDAPPAADWLIVGEAPGENEDIQGEPFVGQAGKLLDNMLRAIGLDRTRNVFITNVLKCRPPGNRNPAPEEVVQCDPYLRRQVELLQPKIILAMGRFAVQSLLQTTEPIGKLRGRMHAYHGVPVVVTYHPAYLLRNLPDKARAWDDLCLAVEAMQHIAAGTAAA